MFNNALELNPGADAVVEKSDTEAEVGGNRAAFCDAVIREGSDAHAAKIEQ